MIRMRPGCGRPPKEAQNTAPVQQIQPPRAEVSFGPDGAAAAPAVADPPRRPRTLHLCSKSSLPGPRSGQGGAMSKASNASKASKARKEGRTDGERGRGMRRTGGGGGEEAATALFKTSTQLRVGKKNVPHVAATFC